MAKKPKDERKFLVTAASGHPDIYPDVAVAEDSYTHAVMGHGTGYAMLDGVIATILDPDEIYDSTTKPGASVILTNAGTTDHNGHPIQVRLKVVPGDENAYLSTFVFTPKPPKGKLIRTRGDKK